MIEEYFDVVNERDEVIGRERRAEVHRRGLRHRAVHVLVFNARGQVFLQKRSQHKDTFPGAWDSSASGHVESGEDYETCVGRELREELGLVPEVMPRRLFKVAACDETGQEFVWVYRCEAEGPLELNHDEIEGGGWFSVAEVTRWMDDRPGDFASALRHIWDRMREEGFI
jgi:isopentenyl-diphosphate delta-isomerase type 1